MERAAHVLEVSHLSIRFGRIDVLSDVSFRVPTGTTLAIIGPDGAGETVLFKALIGAIRYEGDIRVTNLLSGGAAPPLIITRLWRSAIRWSTDRARRRASAAHPMQSVIARSGQWTRPH